MPTFVARTNLPTREAFRWSLSVARRELGVSSGTLSQRLSDSNEAPGEDHCYSSKQIFGCVFGSLHKAKLDQVRQETAHTSLKTSILRGDFLNRAALQDVFDHCATSIKQTIEGSALTRSEKDDILRSISKIPIEIENLAAGSRRGQNGAPSGEDKAARKKRKPKRPAEAEHSKTIAAPLVDEWNPRSSIS